MVATLANEAAVDNVVAHILTFPDNPPEQTVTGDVEAGRKHYNTCAYCHGKDGEGIEAVNAPGLAGATDWYLTRQLENFKSGVRGSHPQDYYGYQMGLLGITLRDEQAIKDVVAYINTL